MRKTVEMAEENGVGVGAHPSFPDLQGFGRRNMVVSPKEAKDDVVYQMGALAAFTPAPRSSSTLSPTAPCTTWPRGGGDLAKAICEAVLEVAPDSVLVVLARHPLGGGGEGDGRAGGPGGLRRPGPEPRRYAGGPLQARVGHP